MKTEVLDLLVEICDEEAVREDLDIDLFESGLMDSLTYTQLLVEIDEKFDIYISPTEIERDEIATPNKIIKYIESRK